MDNLQTTIRSGVYGFVGIAFFFLLMKLFGLENVVFLRVFNLFIVVYLSNRLARRLRHENSEKDYLSNLLSLVLANVITVVLSVVAFFLYVSLIDTDFMNAFKGGVLWSGRISIDQACAALFLEGMAGSMAVSFTLMQYWKDMKTKVPAPLKKV